MTGQSVTFSGAALALWMTAEYDARNMQEMLDMAAEVSKTAQLALADDIIMPTATADTFPVPKGIII